MKILLCVSGSIACYKTFDLVRNLSKKGHELKVILSQGASKFIKPELYRYLGASQTYLAGDDFNTEKYDQGNVLHVELRKWADMIVIAPASANMISRLAQLRVEDLASSVFAANTEKITLIFPAMNTQMLEHPFTQENIKKLNSLPWTQIFPTKSGELACMDQGEGKLLDVEEIECLIESYPLPEFTEQDSKKVLISTGASISSLDPVRYLTNPSSGKTGFALAMSYLAKGHQVKVFAGIKSTSSLDLLKHHPNFELEKLESTTEFEQAILRDFSNYDLYISSAAFCDIEFKKGEHKIKKSSLEGSLEISKAPDILAQVLKNKTKDQKVVGFAAETNLTQQEVYKKWQAKPVDLLVANNVHSGTGGQSQKGFGTDDGQYSLVKEGKIVFESSLTKIQLADEIYRLIYGSNSAN